MNVHVLHQGQQIGPFDDATLRARLAAGEFNPDDLAWHEGMSDWKPLHEVYPSLVTPAARPAGLPLSPVALPPRPFPPTGYPPGPGPFAHPGLPPAGSPRPATGGIPTWVKVLLAVAALGIFLVIGIVGIIGYGAYRAERAAQALRNARISQPTPSEPIPAETPSPAAGKAEDLNNQGFVLYQKKDYAAALPFFERAAALGYSQAQHNLGVMALYGQGVPKDPAVAMGWFSKAAALGYAPAQTQLGLCYSFHAGLPHDYAKAVEWFRKAAAQDDAQGVNNLAAMYEDGLGVPKDRARAREGYQRSAKLGYELAKQNLTRLDAEPGAPPASTPTPAGSPFLGRWQGPWNDPTAGQRGTFTFTVAADGSLEGETRNDTSHVNGPLRGTLDANGNLRANYSYATGNISGGYTAEGRLSRQGNRLVGSIGFFERGRRFGGATVDLTSAR